MEGFVGRKKSTSWTNQPLRKNERRQSSELPESRLRRPVERPYTEECLQPRLEYSIRSIDVPVVCPGHNHRKLGQIYDSPRPVLSDHLTRS